MGMVQNRCVQEQHWLAAALIASAATRSAQDYPTRHITLVAPFQAGGPSDTTARLIAGPMSRRSVSRSWSRT